MASNTPAPLPLAGIKVIELCHLIAGPYCGQMLADEGATVIKIEPPQGELTRHRPPARRADDGEVTAYYASLNRDKKSVVLDLKNPEGAGVLAKLLETADVFVTNMRASALDRLNLHPKALRERYPRLVIASISGINGVSVRFPSSAKPATRKSYTDPIYFYQSAICAPVMKTASGRAAEKGARLDN